MAKSPPHGIGAAPPPAPPHGIQVPTGPQGPIGPTARPFRVTVPGPYPTIPVSPPPTPPTPNTGPGAPPAAPPPPDTTPAPPTQPAYDWRSYLQDWGFPQDIIDELVRIFSTYANPQDAGAAALAFIRGTAWYAATFPGIKEGIKNGVVTDERDYRAYTNNLNQLYQRYYGRNVSGSETAGYLGQGWDLSRIGYRLGGQAWVDTNSPNANYALGAFSPEGQVPTSDLVPLGEEKMGLDSALGQKLSLRLATAQQRLQTIAQGSLATPSMTLLTGTGRPAASSLRPGNSIGDFGS